jgi:hypothetical protein
VTRFDSSAAGASSGMRWPPPGEERGGHPRRPDEPGARPAPSRPGDPAGWSAAPPTPVRRRDGDGRDQDGGLPQWNNADGPAAAPGRPAWVAVVVMAAVTAIGVVIDVVRDATGGVNVAIIVGALVAILIVRRAGMFAVVIAPPLIYLLGSAAVLYLRSGGPHNRTVLIDTATNWLVYGFPAMAAATLLVLIIAAVRMLIRR